ncbi:MAG: Crp/Fnr family transcriptional regulator [Pseudomonadota bacterium]
MSIPKLPAPLNTLARQHVRELTLKAGEAVFLQNAPTTGLFYTLTGIIDLRRTTPEGHDILIHRARAADTFAEASLFSECYHCSAIAAVDSVVVECSRVAITEQLADNADFAQQLLHRFARQLQASRRQVELLHIKSADQRIIAALHDGLLVDDINTFANTIGLTPPTVYRTLRQLADSGTVTKSARGKYQLTQ